MKAVYVDRYGPPSVLAIRDVPIPTRSSDDLLVRVQAAAVTSADWRIRASAFPPTFWLPGRIMFGLLKPKSPIPGMCFAGEVVEAPASGAFPNGTRLFGVAPAGAHAEYLTVAPDIAIARIPDTVSYTEAASVPFGALAALVFLHDFAKIKRGQKILIGGASGSVGVYAVQIAHHFGTDVTAVASAANLPLLQDLGAHNVVDYTTTDIGNLATRFDVVLDTAGTLRYSTARRILTPDGVFVPLEFDLPEILQSLLSARGRVKIGVSEDRREDLQVIVKLLADNTLRPVIDRHYTIDQIAKAHIRVASRHKPGTVVLQVAPDMVLGT